jgi:hypothetical protein
MNPLTNNSCEQFTEVRRKRRRGRKNREDNTQPVTGREYKSNNLDNRREYKKEGRREHRKKNIEHNSDNAQEKSMSEVPKELIPYKKFYDKHTLYLRSGDLSSGQVQQALRNCLNSYVKEHKDKISCKFIVNTILDREDRNVGLSYVYVDREEVYNMLCGKNKDGTSRTEEIDESSKLGDLGDEVSWADIMDEVKTVSLPPLMTLKWKEEEIEVAPAFVRDPPEDKRANVLCCKDIPDWVEEEDILKVAKIYARASLSYPKVETSKGICFVTFDPSTTDGQFALLMMKKTLIQKSNRTAVLFFNHAFQKRKYV